MTVEAAISQPNRFGEPTPTRRGGLTRPNSPETALRRSRVYKLLADAFSYPEGEFFAALKRSFPEELKGHLDFLKTGEAAPRRHQNVSLREAWRDPVGSDSDRSDPYDARKAPMGAVLRVGPLREQIRKLTGLPDLVSEYTRAFGHTLSEECPPYETQCGGPHVFQQTQQLADIAGFYRAFGLKVSDSAKERLDHITVELEFMRFLTYKQAYAVSHHGEQQVALCLDGQRKFLEKHLGRWIPVFATLLAKKVGGEFYKEMAALTVRWVREDAERIGAKPRPLGENTWEPAGLLAVPGGLTVPGAPGMAAEGEEACSTCPMVPSSQGELSP